jgi:hypothetical protein
MYRITILAVASLALLLVSGCGSNAWDPAYSGVSTGKPFDLESDF